MVIVIIILSLIILGLLTYLFLLNIELKELPKRIDTLKSIETNNLIYSRHNLRNIKSILIKINALLKESKRLELQYAKKNKALMKMMINISHDLRTPLTSAIGYIDIILNSEISEEEKRKELIIIEERLKRLEELINSFFEFSNIISNNGSPELEKINLKVILENCLANYYEDYKKQNRKIIYINDQMEILIYSNKKLLTRVLDNLIGNAYKHSLKDLIITVKVEDKIRLIFENELQYEELDTEKMFEEFYTVDISRTNGNTGLGLAIAKEFTEELGGKIYANKKNNKLEIIVELLQFSPKLKE